jgi:hypothetical protein
MAIGRLRAGDQLTAALLNQIIDAVNTGGTIRAGAGIDVKNIEGDVTISLARMVGEHVKLARIVSHTGSPIDEARNIRYTVREFESVNQLVNVYPTWGRPTRRDDVEIHAARAGSLCWIVREPTSEGSTVAKLWIPAGGSDGETLAFFECSPELPATVVAGTRSQDGAGPGAPIGGGIDLPPVDGEPGSGSGGSGSAGGIFGE